MEFEAYNFVPYFELISVSNQNLMTQLLIHHCISHTQLLHNLKIIFHHLHEIPIECSTFYCVLNFSITKYLQYFVLELYHFSQNLMDYNINTYGLMRRLFYELGECILENFNQALQIYFANDHFSYGIPIKVSITNSETAVSLNTKDIDDKKDNISVDDDFKSFLLPLEQDYTKSSKGYTEQKISFDEKVNPQNACNILNQPDSLNTEDDDDDECYYNSAHDSIISKYLNLVNSISSDSESNSSVGEFLDSDSDDSYSDDSDSDDSDSDDSDSDDSVVFSENVKAEKVVSINKKYGGKTVELNHSFSYDDSDSDDDVFFERTLDASLKKDSRLKSTFEKNKLYGYASSRNRDDMYQIYDEFNSSPMFQCSDLNFKKSNSKQLVEISSLSQPKIHVYKTNSDGYANPCFENDENDNDVSQTFKNMRNINKNWENTMKDVSSEARQAKKVSFVPLPDLVSVQIFECDDDGYRYSTFVLDQIRFQNRITEFEGLIAPYLSEQHRKKIYLQNYLCKN